MESSNLYRVNKEEDLEKLKDALKMRPDIAENSSLYKADGENVSPIEYN